MDTSSPWADTPPAPAVAQQGAEVGAAHYHTPHVCSAHRTTLHHTPHQHTTPDSTHHHPQATGWADFGAASFGGGGEEGGWSPAMVSSPEATMLEEGGEPRHGASPTLEDRLQDQDQEQEVKETKGDEGEEGETKPQATVEEMMKEVDEGLKEFKEEKKEAIEEVKEKKSEEGKGEGDNR